MKFFNRISLTAMAVVMATSTAFAGDISGAGSTFAFPILSKWAEAYKAATGVGMNYQSIGSGGGIKQIKAKTVTFGASDAPLTGEELKASGLVQFPMIMGGIVPIVNLDGIKAGDLVLDGPTMADIYLGKIIKWNDAAIAKLNPKLTLPATDIAVVERSDGSGTTYNFTYYLADVSKEWKEKVGVDKAVQWPVGVGAKGNEGVAAGVANAKGAIGFVEFAFALQNKMTYADMINKNGKTIVPSAAAFQAAASSADWKSAPGYGVILANQPGDASWPMTAATFVLVYGQPQDEVATGEALKFFDWAFVNGTKQAQDLAYVPMPAAVIGEIQKTWAAEIKGKDGKALMMAK